MKWRLKPKKKPKKTAREALCERLGVQLLCRDCAPKPDPTFREKPLAWFVGKDVKKSFATTDGSLEHMWVHVDKADSAADVLRGYLINTPVSLNEGGVRLGSAVQVRRDEIAAVVETCDCDKEFLDDVRRGLVVTSDKERVLEGALLAFAASRSEGGSDDSK